MDEIYIYIKFSILIIKEYVSQTIPFWLPLVYLLWRHEVTSENPFVRPSVKISRVAGNKQTSVCLCRIAYNINNEKHSHDSLYGATHCAFINLLQAICINKRLDRNIKYELRIITKPKLASVHFIHYSACRLCLFYSY